MKYNPSINRNGVVGILAAFLMVGCIVLAVIHFEQSPHLFVFFILGFLTLAGMAWGLWGGISKQRMAYFTDQQNLLLNNIDVQMWFLTDDHTYGLVNAAHAEYFGKKPEEMSFRTMYNVHDKAYVEWCRLSVSEVFSTGRAISTEEWIKNAHGEERLLSIVKVPKKKADGTTQYVICTANDITNRRRTEDALVKSREQFLLAVNGSQDGIWDWDIANDTLFLSTKWKQMIGYEDEELPNTFETFEHRIHPDDKERVMSYVNRYLAGKEESYHVEFRFRHRDGSYRWILARGQALRDEKGIPYRMAGSHTDITPRKKFQKQIEASKQRAETIMQSVQSAVVVVDYESRRITDANPVACAMIGSSRDEIIGKKCVGYICTPSECQCPISNLGEKVEGMERSLRRIDGSFLPILKTINCVELDGKKCFIESFVDISEQKEQQCQLQKALKEAEELNNSLEHETALANSLVAQAEMASSAKGEFLANMSHEIRTPMNGVIGLTELLLDTDLSDDQRRYAETVQSSAQSLMVLVNDILDFSKIEAGKFEIELMDFNLRSLLDDFAEIMAVKADEKKLELICDAAPQVPALVRGDPGRLRQILINLAGNAVKFTHSGEVAILASLEKETESHAVIRFSVKDTGIGIPKSKQEFIFEKFNQVDGSITRKFGGTGLGLAISKQLVEMMGGRIGLNSEDGAGAEFWFVVPFEKQRGTEQTMLAAPDMLQDVSILFVDDNETNRFVMKEQMQSWGARIILASDGAEALKELSLRAQSDEPVKIVITDHSMPGMSGEDLGHAILGTKEFQGVRLIMMTSVGQRGDAEIMQKAGFVGYLEKPVRLTELRDCLLAVIGIDDKFGKEKTSLVTRHSIRDIRLSSKRILIAEDNLTNQEVARGILTKYGYHCDIVSNGEEAISALKARNYDIVLMDLQMPRMDGFETVRYIRSCTDGQSGIQADIPVVAMTAHAMAGDRELCIQAGMNDYVSKPFEPRELNDVVRKWIFHSDREETGSHGAGEVPPESEHLIITSPEIFNTNQLMQRLDADVALAHKILAGFMRDIPSQIKVLSSLIDDRDAKAAGRRAHTIKGAAAVVSGCALERIAFEMEKAGAHGNIHALIAFLPELEKQFELLGNEILQFIDRG